MSEFQNNKKLSKWEGQRRLSVGMLADLFLVPPSGLLYLGHNYLTGKIPDIFDDLTALSTLQEIASVMA